MNILITSSSSKVLLVKQFKKVASNYPNILIYSGATDEDSIAGKFSDKHIIMPKDNDPEFINNLSEEELLNYKLDDGARAYMISRLLEDDPEGSNLRDVMSKYKDFEGFMNFASSKFSTMIGSDPSAQTACPIPPPPPVVGVPPVPPDIVSISTISPEVACCKA